MWQQKYILSHAAATKVLGKAKLTQVLHPITISNFIIFIDPDDKILEAALTLVQPKKISCAY